MRATLPGTTRGGNRQRRTIPRHRVPEFKIHEITCESERHIFLTMDSLHHDLRDALDEADSDRNQVSAAAEQSSQQGYSKCRKCRSLSAPGSKLRYCGRCESTPYCCKACARADWAEHKLECDSLRRAHDAAFAAHLARGESKKDFRKCQDFRDLESWFQGVPGLFNEIELLAWKHRRDALLFYVTTPRSDGDGSGVQIEMIPRSVWEEDPRFLDTFLDSDRELLRLRFDASSLSPNENFVCLLVVYRQGQPDEAFVNTYEFLDAIRGAAIVDALTAATRAEDLADAFAWVSEFCPSDSAQIILENIRNRAILIHGSTMPQGSVPVPTRAINNEVAISMMHLLHLKYEIRLTGLRNAAHLNGREGIILGPDSASPERWRARLDDGTCISVKAANFVHVRRGDYKRESP